MTNKTKRIEAELMSFVVVLGLFYSSLVYNASAGEISIPNVVKLVNTERKARGLNELQESEKLDQVANDKLADMVDNQYFAHKSPSGVTPWYWFVKNEYDYEYAGENLAIDFVTAERQNNAWMNSESHRKNILNPKYQEIGVAVGTGEIDGKVSIITVQVFGTLAMSGAPANNPDNFEISQKAQTGKNGTVLSSQDLKLGQYENMKFDGAPNSWKEEKAQQVQAVWWTALIAFALAMVAMPAIMVYISHREIYWAFKRMNELDARNMEKYRARFS